MLDIIPSAKYNLIVEKSRKGLNNEEDAPYFATDHTCPGNSALYGLVFIYL
jgi:hypothetical protein